MGKVVSPEPQYLYLHEVEEEPAENLIRVTLKWRVGHGTGEKQLI